MITLQHNRICHICKHRIPKHTLAKSHYSERGNVVSHLVCYNNFKIKEYERKIDILKKEIEKYKEVV